MRPLQAHCYLSLGTLYAKIGWREQARAALSAAIALYRAMDMTFWLPQAEAALAQAEERLWTIMPSRQLRSVLCESGLRERPEPQGGVVCHTISRPFSCGQHLSSGVLSGGGKPQDITKDRGPNQDRLQVA